MAVTTLQLAAMTDSDIEAVLELERDIFPAPWTEQMLREELAAAGRTYVVASEASTVVGYGGIMLIGSDAHIMTLAVDPGHRRSRVATRLLLALIDAALAQGAEHLTLELRLSNAAARALYERFGFTPVGVRPRYYGDEDALVMWAVDANGAEYRRTLDLIRGATV